jgi:hypothetical protein
MKRDARKSKEFQYDVCLSFAGEDRVYVERVANCLTSKGIRVFYDKYERVELWGKDLYSHLDYVYRHAGKYCVVFVSKQYASKLWTNHERRSAQARAFSENREYILPARFDDTAIPGLPETVGYLDLRRMKPQKLATSIFEKLGPRQRKNFLPPVPDRLFKRVAATNRREKTRVYNIAFSFFEAYERMSVDERTVIAAAFLLGCVANLPENIHISLDLLRRATKFPPAKTKRVLAGLSSLGFSTSLREEPGRRTKSLGTDEQVVIVFHALTSSVEPGDDETGVVAEMILGAGDDLCEGCSLKALKDGDFSQLASSTTEKEIHNTERRKIST